MRLGRQHGRAAAPLLAAFAAALAGCGTLQRWPGPMPAAAEPLPAGLEAVEEGLDEVLVTRLADQVRVREAGTVGSVPLTFVDKRRRLRSGSSVDVASGGRAEVVWPGEGLMVQLFDAGSLRVGVRERGEPAALLHRPTRARLVLPGGSSVRLVDACDLVAPEGSQVGPLWLERALAGHLRLFNNGNLPLTLDFGGTRLALGPSQSVDLVELDPRASAARDGRGELPELLPLPGGVLLRWSGPLVLEPAPAAVGLAAAGGAVRVHALGTTWHLGAGERVYLSNDPAQAPTRP